MQAEDIENAWQAEKIEWLMVNVCGTAWNDLQPVSFTSFEVGLISRFAL